MNPYVEHINRLGFEAWADNLIVNALEDMAANKCWHFNWDMPELCIRIRTDGKTGEATIRAYVEGEGWKTNDRVINLNDGPP